MDKNVLAVSFEAYGNRIGNQTGGYDLTDIEFAGGALLIKTKPAFPGSEVTEIAKRRERVLEMASVMTEPKEYIHTSEKKKSIDTAKKKGTDNLDNNLGGRKSMTIEELKKKVESLEGEKASLETQLKEKDQAIAKKDESLDKKSEKLEKVQATVEELKKESEEVKAKIEDVEQAKEKEISKAKEDAKVVATRRAELDSFAKDLSDEDLLNDAKYELAKANQKLAAKEKEIEELKNSGSDEDMSKGSRKTKKKDGDPVELSAKKVDEYTRW
jgi:chromosome segregation ATPase